MTLGWRVVEVMDTHKVCFTTIDIIHFKTVIINKEDADDDDKVLEAKKLIGVFPELTSATAAHDAAQDVLSFLRDYKITDINVDFQESIYTCYAGPQLLQPVSDDPLIDVVSPLTPALASESLPRPGPWLRE
ncbi:hypothetical protein EDC04DRAFT_2602376 [Pisolithus marmoratus]|nr:hypothetical protein EDC04DRAFT_2602376 [Pisolithus marmoratus]